MRPREGVRRAAKKLFYFCPATGPRGSLPLPPLSNSIKAIRQPRLKSPLIVFVSVLYRSNVCTRDQTRCFLYSLKAMLLLKLVDFVLANRIWRDLNAMHQEFRQMYTPLTQAGG